MWIALKCWSENHLYQEKNMNFIANNILSVSDKSCVHTLNPFFFAFLHLKRRSFYLSHPRFAFFSLPSVYVSFPAAQPLQSFLLFCFHVSLRPVLAPASTGLEAELRMKLRTRSAKAFQQHKNNKLWLFVLDSIKMNSLCFAI